MYGAFEKMAYITMFKERILQNKIRNEIRDSRMFGGLP